LHETVGHISSDLELVDATKPAAVHHEQGCRDFLVGDLGAGPAQQTSRDRVTSAVRLVQHCDLPVEHLAKRQRSRSYANTKGWLTTL
jgi:hypothetical protein